MLLLGKYCVDSARHNFFFFSEALKMLIITPPKSRAPSAEWTHLQHLLRTGSLKFTPLDLPPPSGTPRESLFTNAFNGVLLRI